AAQKDWESGDDKLVARLATASAEAVAPLLADEPPAISEKAAASEKVATVETATPANAPAPAAAPGNDKVRLAMGEVKGAPGDGGKSLARAVLAIALILADRQRVGEDLENVPDLLLIGGLDDG